MNCWLYKPLLRGWGAEGLTHQTTLRGEEVCGAQAAHFTQREGHSGPRPLPQQLCWPIPGRTAEAAHPPSG